MELAREHDLYPPVKRFLEAQGYAVRGEVGRCDLLAVRDDVMIIVELKLAFGLPVLYQAVERLALTDLVYVAVREPRTAARRSRRGGLDQAVRLCRLLGLGLLSIGARGVTVHAEPGPYRPRRRTRERARLLGEFSRRSGDYNEGGVSRRPVVTAYREDALRCAALLAETGTLRVGEIRSRTGVERAGTILLRNVYAWFERVGRGSYGLTAAGRDALVQFSPVIAGHQRGSAGNGEIPCPADIGPDPDQ
jgi:hypothetical protein